MKTNEAVEAAQELCKTKGWDHEVPLLIGQLALILQIEALIEAFQQESQKAIEKSDIRAGHLSRIEELLKSRPI